MRLFRLEDSFNWLKLSSSITRKTLHHNTEILQGISQKIKLNMLAASISRSYEKDNESIEIRSVNLYAFTNRTPLMLSQPKAVLRWRGIVQQQGCGQQLYSVTLPQMQWYSLSGRWGTELYSITLPQMQWYSPTRRWWTEAVQSNCTWASFVPVKYLVLKKIYSVKNTDGI